MARDVREDFEQLEQFVRSYKLADPAATPEFRDLLSRQHKLYHAILTLVSEIAHQGWRPLAGTDPRATTVNPIFNERLLEFSSDLGSALFAWLHGGYKAARLLLRSAIENIIKAIGVIDHDDIVTLRNTYEVFDRAESGTFFSMPDNSRRFQSLQNDYSTLSRDVHTATATEMQHVAALNYFPRFDQQDASSFATLFVRCAAASLESLVLMCADAYRSAHHRNRDVINGVLPAPVRATLNQRDRTQLP